MQCLDPVGMDPLRVQAYVDDELDAVSRAQIERHVHRCASCRALCSQLQELSTAIHQELPVATTPTALRHRVLQALDTQALDMQALDMQPAAADSRQKSRLRDSARRPFWLGAASGIAAAGAAAALAFLTLLVPARNAIVEGFLTAHVNSLMSSHLIDIASTDRHTVKPWFAGRVDVTPEVADFAPQGFTLTGGRIDFLKQQRVAVVVYRHGAHIINLFCWSAPAYALPANATRKGYHLLFWKSGDLAYAAIADTGWDELMQLERLVQARAGGR